MDCVSAVTSQSLFDTVRVTMVIATFADVNDWNYSSSLRQRGTMEGCSQSWFEMEEVDGCCCPG